MKLKDLKNVKVDIFGLLAFVAFAGACVALKFQAYNCAMLSVIAGVIFLKLWVR